MAVCRPHQCVGVVATPFAIAHATWHVHLMRFWWLDGRFCAIANQFREKPVGFAEFCVFGVHARLEVGQVGELVGGGGV